MFQTSDRMFWFVQLIGINKYDMSFNLAHDIFQLELASKRSNFDDIFFCTEEKIERTNLVLWLKNSDWKKSWLFIHQLHSIEGNNAKVKKSQREECKQTEKPTKRTEHSELRVNCCKHQSKFVADSRAMVLHIYLTN